MPGENKEDYKEMFEMGTRLVEMAKAGGYDPSETSEEVTPEATPVSSGNADKVQAAMNMFSGGK